MAPTANDLLIKAKEVLKNEGTDLDAQELSNTDLLNEFILPGLKNSKDTLSTIYAFQSRAREGILGQFKTKIQNKIINTVVNVIEKPSMKQQKFNELTYQAIEKLVAENAELRRHLQSKA